MHLQKMTFLTNYIPPLSYTFLTGLIFIPPFVVLLTGTYAVVVISDEPLLGE